MSRFLRADVQPILWNLVRPYRAVNLGSSRRGNERGNTVANGREDRDGDTERRVKPQRLGRHAGITVRPGGVVSVLWPFG